jgi:UDP-2-acetamido-3-amino-2,3-dideoxy-glucuronate N-acetyltransferase
MNSEQYTVLSWSEKLPKGIHSSVQFGRNVVIGLNVIIEEDVVIGDNTLICHNTVIRPNARIGNNVELRVNVHVDPDAVIGDYTHIFPYGLVGGGWEIGSHVWYGPFTVTTNSSIPTILNPSSIGDYAIIYSGCEIAPGVKIGTGGVLGMGSVLTKDIAPLEMWWGNPAVYRKKVTKKNLFIEDNEPWPEVFKGIVK